MTDQNAFQTEFATFDVSRDIDAPAPRVWSCWTQADLKAAWFAKQNDPSWETIEFASDFRVGGTEHGVFRHADIGEFTYSASILDIREGARAIYTYKMFAGQRLLSISQATLVLIQTRTQTRLTYTEQAVFIDGGDKIETRLAGTADLLTRLKSLAEEAENA